MGTLYAGSCTRSLRAFLGQRVGEASHPGPAVPARPAAPPGAEPVAPGTKVCFRTVEKEVSDPGDRRIKSTKRAMVKVVFKYYVRKLAALACVYDKDGADVGCYTDAEFFYSKWIDGERVINEEPLTPQVHPRYGAYTLRVKCHEESKAMVYARMIVAWAFNRGHGPADFEAFKKQGWEGDHLTRSSGEVPLGRASVVCGWIKGVTHRRHAWEEWTRDAAQRLETQSIAYAACVNEIAKEREGMQKKRDEAEEMRSKALDAWRKARDDRKDGKCEAHVVEQRKVEVRDWELKREQRAKRMAKAPERVQQMWQQYVMKYHPRSSKPPPELTDFKWECRCGVLCSLTRSLLLHS